MTLLAFLLAIVILVGFHELGHFSVAKLCGVDVLRFSIGFGRPVWKSVPKSPSDTEWVIGSIPLGGYVKLLDHRDLDQKIDPFRAERAFDRQVLWKRSAIVAAGPIANFLLAFLLFAIIYFSGVKQLNPILDEPISSSIAIVQGVHEGDQVVGIFNADEPQDVEPIVSWNRLRWKLLKKVIKGEDFGLEILSKSGGTYRAMFSLGQYSEFGSNELFDKLGLRPFLKEPIKVFELNASIGTAIYLAADRVWDITAISIYSVRDLVLNRASIKQLSGPISIAEMAGKSAGGGFQSFLAFLALISISLGILNLLPFPMLDGGQLLYDFIELITGRRISVGAQMVLQKIGFIGIISLTFIAFFNDLVRLFGR